ncbi:MAG: ECF transporter S component [Propionibacteriaceae bacterium]|nr:ECF transporter S component [Propionibacteriaceae bacterium]
MNDAFQNRGWATGRLVAWRSVDLVTIAIIGVALGVAFWGWDLLLYPGISAVLNAIFPPASSLTLGVWVLPAVIGALVVRRPGAALLCELMAATVESLLGNQWGLNVVISGTLQGLGLELAMALFAWRRFTAAVAVLGALLAATLELCVWEWWVYQAEYTMVMRFAALGCALISSSVIAGWGGWLFVRGVAATGALDAFPAGRERQAGS